MNKTDRLGLKLAKWALRNRIYLLPTEPREVPLTFPVMRSQRMTSEKTLRRTLNAAQVMLDLHFGSRLS